MNNELILCVLDARMCIIKTLAINDYHGMNNSVEIVVPERVTEKMNEHEYFFTQCENSICIFDGHMIWIMTSPTHKQSTVTVGGDHKFTYHVDSVEKWQVSGLW